jgi:glucan endo-1,3-alpha-glucosidase
VSSDITIIRTQTNNFCRIVTWNDYGESHYIGPNPDSSEIPTGSHDFVEPLKHTGWLSLLPYHISQYKGTKYVQKWDKLTFWYRDAPCTAGDSSWVVGNNGNQGQKEVPAVEIMSDRIFLSSWLTADAEIHVKIGDNGVHSEPGKKGFNHFSVEVNGQRGVPTFSVVRDGQTVYSKDGREISDNTQMANGRTNFNAYVDSF